MKNPYEDSSYRSYAQRRQPLEGCFPLRQAQGQHDNWRAFVLTYTITLDCMVKEFANGKSRKKEIDTTLG